MNIENFEKPKKLKFSKKDSENLFSDTSKMHLLWRSIFGVLKNFYKKILDTFKIKDIKNL